MVEPRNPYLKGRLSKVDLVLTSLNHLLLIQQILFTFLQKQASLMRRPTTLSLSVSFLNNNMHDKLYQEILWPVQRKLDHFITAFLIL
jgi:hypothetical protein